MCFGVSFSLNVLITNKKSKTASVLQLKITNMLESKIEKYLKRECERRGWVCRKWVSPGNSAVPDRIILLQGGFVAFAECKAPGKDLSPLQREEHKQLNKLGQMVRKVDSLGGVDCFIEELEEVQKGFKNFIGLITKIQTDATN